MGIPAILAAAICVFFAEGARAKDFPAAGRLFVGSATVDPTDVNQELTAGSLKEIDNVTQLGVEITYPLAKFFDVGLRYTKRLADQDELVSNPSTDYLADLDQDAIAFVARVPFFKSAVLRIDAFGGIGGSNTTLKLKTATQDGELTRKAAGDWFAAPYAVYGGSLALGYKRFYFVVEGGMEVNKIDDLKRSGSVNANIETIDLSGSYITIGLLFDGITATRK